MDRNQLIGAFDQLGSLMVSFGKKEEWPGFTCGITAAEYATFDDIIKKEKVYNGWFTEASVRQSLLALGTQLNGQSLEEWLESYGYTSEPKTVALIMAGNIPMVGFHDFCCVLLSGNKVLAKLSSDDKHLIPALAQLLIQFLPDLEKRIRFAVGPLKDFGAVIATGSDNSALYFESYFGKYPHIFRKNRTSVAVLDGTETETQLEALGQDMFAYFGMGCRNVTHLLLPAGYDINKIFSAILPQSEVIQNNKYGNNYDYNKAVYLMNKIPLLDNNFVLFRESDELFSPLAMVHYQYYSSQAEVDQYIKENREKIQVIVGKNDTPFGTAQCPGLDDYADDVDTMAWLNNL